MSEKKAKKKENWWTVQNRSYRNRAKKNGMFYDLSPQESKLLMSLPCFYCTKPQSKGIDRLDSSKGYERDNIVSCCKYCNFILSDLPYLAKMEMRDSLKNIRQKNLLKDWEPSAFKNTKQETQEEKEECWEKLVFESIDLERMS